MTQMQTGYTPDWIKQAIAAQLPPPAVGNQSPGYERADAAPQYEGGPRDLPTRQPGSPSPNGGRYVPPDNRTEF